MPFHAQTIPQIFVTLGETPTGAAETAALPAPVVNRYGLVEAGGG